MKLLKSYTPAGLKKKHCYCIINLKRYEGEIAKFHGDLNLEFQMLVALHVVTTSE